MFEELAQTFRLSKGYRLHPWDSPYLRWRVETGSGIPAEDLNRERFIRFAVRNFGGIRGYLRWAVRNRRRMRAGRMQK